MHPALANRLLARYRKPKTAPLGHIPSQKLAT
jgi:hypothetical protein